MKIEGVVVLYNPNKNIIDNIKTYINEVETLYVIDNSSEKDNSLINEIKQLSQKCLYIDNFSNKGIAYALNMGVKLAIKESSDWLLTMDQDSKFEKNDLFKLIESIDEDDIQNIGIISPLHNINEHNMNSDNNHITMTSGNLLNLHILEKIGFFLEDLFIDSVDTEYCLRLYEHGYRIKRNHAVLLNHNLGEQKVYTLLWKKYTSSNHNAIRRYYMMRNRLYIWDKYSRILPSFIARDKKEALKEALKIILFEDKKISKVLYILKGCFDYKRKKFGKIND